MKKSNKKLLVFTILSIMILITGCASIRDKISLKKGQLLGQKFDIEVYDHYADKVLEIIGDKVTVELLENESNIDPSTEGHKSGVLEITINGNQMFQVGNTMIFKEKGLDMVEGFDLPEKLDVSKGGSYVPFDKFINNYANKIGKDKTIIVSTPMGTPIGVYQGKKVYVTVPNDLPKMTRLNIDGKSLYIHRANYIILDSEAIKK